MASHNQPGKIVPLHRGVTDQPRDYAVPRFVRKLRPVDYDARIDLLEALRVRRGLLDRIADWLGTDRGFTFFLGFYSGAMFCCGTMILWVVL